MASRVRLIRLMCLVVILAAHSLLSAEEPAKPQEVPVAKPTVREVTDHGDYAGFTEPSELVKLQSRVTGYLTATPFKEGSQVKQGDVLFEVDPRPYQAQLDLALSQIKLDQAKLQIAKATLARDRAAAKAERGSASPEQLDLDQAVVDEAQSRVKASEVAAEVHKLNLSFCKVIAPVSGLVGRSLVSPGNVVMQDQTHLTTLFGVDPMYVYFDLDERTFLRLRKLKQKEASEAVKLPVDIGMGDDEGFAHHGMLDFALSVVDPQTGTIRVRTSLSNKNGLLMPGMSVRVRLTLSEPRKALLVLDQAIGSDQGIKYVYILDTQNKVQYRRITVGQLQMDGLRVITEGLKPEDRVVIGRPSEQRPGTVVQPHEIDMVPLKRKQPIEKTPPPLREESSARVKSGSGFLVEATYPGADAQDVSDSVRFPIESQVSGLEKIRHLRSRCYSDGTYFLDVAFAKGVDPLREQIQLQNRVALAMPQLPNNAQESGVRIKRGNSGALLIVNLFSKEGIFDERFLGNYANIEARDELGRIDGVSEIALLGSTDYVLRILLDPDSLTARNLNVVDVVRALREEKRDQGGDFEKLADFVVKVDSEGRSVRLRDAGRLDFGAGLGKSKVFQDGNPAVSLVLYLTGEVAPSKVRDAVLDRLSRMRPRMPHGLDFNIVFDFTNNLETSGRPTAPEYLLVDLDLPSSTSEILRASEKLVAQVSGVRHVLSLSQNPFDFFGGRSCLLVQLGRAENGKMDNEEIIRSIRARLATLEGVSARVRDLTRPGAFPRCGYPLDLALYGPDLGLVRRWSSEIADRLSKNKKMTDVWVNRDSEPRSRSYFDINREAALTRGVAMADVISTLQVYGGTLPANSFNRFGRNWRIDVQALSRSGDWATDLGQLKVRNAKDQMIPLASFVKVREVESPQALDFLDLWPMVQLTANPASGVSVDDGQKLMTTLVEEVRKELGLKSDYRFSWLQEMPR